MRAWWTKPRKSPSGKAARSPASVAPGAGRGAAEGGDAHRQQEVGRRGEQLEGARPVGQVAPDLVGPGGHPAVGVDEETVWAHSSFQRFFIHCSSSSRMNSSTVSE